MHSACTHTHLHAVGEKLGGCGGERKKPEDEEDGRKGDGHRRIEEEQARKVAVPSLAVPVGKGEAPW